MKEQLYTIPLHDAFDAQDECPFCYIQRNLEQHAINFVLGSGASYMEKEIRGETDEIGFCRSHFKKMYEYGNRLGCALILSTHIKKKNEELEKKLKNIKPQKISPLKRLGSKNTEENPITQWIKNQEKQCYICDYYNNTYERYLETFFVQYKKDPDFTTKVENCKGFCIPHFGDLLQKSTESLSFKEYSEFFEKISSVMMDNLKRVEDDILWFCDKFDYRNKDADWKNSKDAIQRTMQKLGSGYPADPPFTQD